MIHKTINTLLIVGLFSFCIYITTSYAPRNSLDNCITSIHNKCVKSQANQKLEVEYLRIDLIQAKIDIFNDILEHKDSAILKGKIKSLEQELVIRKAKIRELETIVDK